MSAETCKWCSNPPRPGDNVCHRCAASLAVAATCAFCKTKPCSCESILTMHNRSQGELAAANREIARLQREAADNTTTMGACLREREAAHTLLGRAVAALCVARRGLADIYRHIDQDRESKAMKACKPICDAIDAALAPAPPAEPAPTCREWLRAELAAANEEIARLKADAAWCAKHSVMQPCQHCPDERIVAKLGEETTRRSEMQVRLGRALTALQDGYRQFVATHVHGPRAHCGDCATGKRMQEAIVDAESKDAGEAWLGQQALMLEAMHMLCYVDAHMNERVAVAEKLAKAIGHPWPPYPDAHDADDCEDDDCQKCGGP